MALDTEPDASAAAFLRLILLTGLRKTAALSLRWEDIDFERSLLTLRGEHAKSGKTEILPLSPGAVQALQSIHKADSQGWVFPSPRDSSLHREDFARAAKRARALAGLPLDFRRLHGLRHEFASMLAQSGKVSLLEISKLLTHGDTSITERYAHLLPERLRGAADVAFDTVKKAGD